MTSAIASGKPDVILDEIVKQSKFQADLVKLGQVNTGKQKTSRVLNDARASLQQIYSNFFMISKFFVAGISGFVCPDCLEFEAICIKDLGFDRTMQHRHFCRRSDVEIEDKIPDYRSILPAIELGANDSLFTMTKWWLSGRSFLKSYEMPISGLASEIYVVDAHSEDWLRAHAREKRREIDDDDLKKFLALAKGTYAIFNFSEKDRFLMFVSR